MLLIEKCACPCLLKMGKPSLWLLPVDTTSHVDLTLFFLFCFFKLLCCRFLAVDWSLQGRHELLPDDLSDPATSLPFYPQQSSRLCLNRFLCIFS